MKSDMALAQEKRIDQASFEEMLMQYDLFDVAMHLTESALEASDLMRRDLLDRFLDYVFFKIQTGYAWIENMAFPSKRMNDTYLEEKVVELMNEHLYPEIVLRLIRIFLRNLYDADSNLYFAYLIHSEDIIRSIFSTFEMIRGDIMITDMAKRALNVKRLQQFSPHSENRLSSPLDAAARLKYILDYYIVIGRNGSVYTSADIKMSG